MGQVLRIATYDHAGNQKNAVSVLKVGGASCNWFRLDDGVMGGQSETKLSKDGAVLRFAGTINTNGGGFCSIRTPCGEITSGSGVRLRLKGDGRTYKFIMGDGSRSSPFAGKPSWQCDIETKPDEDWKEIELTFDKLLPSFGGSAMSDKKHTFDVTEMKEVGLMLSLKLADGRPNPTYSEGLFDFELLVSSIEIF